MICQRHQAIATHTEDGVAYCQRCFREAIIEADTVELERMMRRPISVKDLMRRLEGRK